MSDYTRQDFYNKSDLKNELGFTDAMIRDLMSSGILGKPIERQNPMFRSGSPMMLWRKSEIEQVMTTDEFRAAKEKADKRRASSAKAVAAKKDKTMRDVEEAISRIVVMKAGKSRDEVLRAGVAHKVMLDDARAANRGQYNESVPDDYYSADEATKERWAVNYIRHELTEYDEELWGMAGKVGVSEAYKRYKAAVLHAIASKYPFLTDECERQSPTLTS